MADKISVTKIHPSPEQVTEMITLHVQTFIDTALRRAFFPDGGVDVAEEQAFREGMMARSLDDPNRHWVAAFLETPLPDGTTRQKIIGYAGFESPNTSGIEQKKDTTDYRPDGMDKAAHDKFLGKVVALFKQMAANNPQDYWSEFLPRTMRCWCCIRLTA